MRDYVIITDSGCDLSADMVEALGVDVLPMKLMIDGNEYNHYHDYRELSMNAFYDKVRAGCFGQTSCVSTGVIAEAMENYIQKGMDILYISLSSGLSGSYASALVAADTVMDDYPDAVIKVIDTKSVSVGIGMLVYLAAKNKRAGMNIEDNAQYLNEHARNICHYFMVDDLKYLQKSGRISTISAIAGTAVGIKPIFIMNDEGKIAVTAKVRGTKIATKRLAEAVAEKCNDASDVFIVHMDNLDGATALSERIKEKYPDTNIIVNNVGPIIGNHTGFGTLAVIFHGDCR
jgi:DegV family protein with EDD domain